MYPRPFKIFFSKTKNSFYRTVNFKNCFNLKKLKIFHVSQLVKGALKRFEIFILDERNRF